MVKSEENSLNGHLGKNILFPGKFYKVCLHDHRAALPFVSVQLRSCPLRHPVSICGWSLRSDKQASVPCRQCHCVAWPEYLGNKANTCPRQLLPFSRARTPNQGGLHFQDQSTEATDHHGSQRAPLRLLTSSLGLED